MTYFYTRGLAGARAGSAGGDGSPGDVVAATDFFPQQQDRLAVFVDGGPPAPAAGRSLAAVAEDFFPRAWRKVIDGALHKQSFADDSR
jgi:hypothetical protein